MQKAWKSIKLNDESYQNFGMCVIPFHIANHLHAAWRGVDYSLTPWVGGNSTPSCLTAQLPWKGCGHRNSESSQSPSAAGSGASPGEQVLPPTGGPGSRLLWIRGGGGLGSLSKWGLVWVTRWLSGRTGVPEPLFPSPRVRYHKVARIRA